jgi:uncharacterized protein (DUF433 family)
MSTSTAQFIKSVDPRAMPRYSIGEAARYLRLPPSTLRAWFEGTTYGSRPFLKHFKPILKPASKDYLSFYDVASAHVLMAFKAKGVNTENLRTVIQSLEKTYPNARYPLLGTDFSLFGKDVVIKELGQLMNLSKHRQLGLKAVMEKFLSRLEFEDDALPSRFSPIQSAKGWIVIDPELSSGRPVVRGSGIAAEIIAKRKESGESVSSLSKDYHLSRRAVEEAITYFETSKAA